MVLLSVAAFKVHFTSLSRYCRPCTVSHSSLFPHPFRCCFLYGMAGLCMSLCIFNWVCCVCVYAWMYEYMLLYFSLPLLNVSTRVCVYVHTHVCMLCLCVCVCALLPRQACLHSQICLCLLVSTYISAYSEHSLSESEAERTNFQPAVLPCCLSAERWFSSSSIMARCKKSKKQASGPGIRTALQWREVGRKWHCCCYSDHKSVRLEPTYISYKYDWSLKATKRGKRGKKTCKVLAWDSR